MADATGPAADPTELANEPLAECPDCGENVDLRGAHTEQAVAAVWKAHREADCEVFTTDLTYDEAMEPPEVEIGASYGAVVIRVGEQAAHLSPDQASEARFDLLEAMKKAELQEADE